MKLSPEKQMKRSTSSIHVNDNQNNNIPNFHMKVTSKLEIEPTSKGSPLVISNSNKQLALQYSSHGYTDENATRMLDEVFRPKSRETEKFRQTHMNLELVKNIDRIIESNRGQNKPLPLEFKTTEQINALSNMEHVISQQRIKDFIKVENKFYQKVDIKERYKKPNDE